MRTLYKLLAWVWFFFALAHFVALVLVVSDRELWQYIGMPALIWMGAGVLGSGLLGALIVLGYTGEGVRLLAWVLCLHFPFGTAVAIFTLIALHHPENQDA